MIIEPQLRPIVTKRQAATTWPWHMKGLEVRFVSALFLWAFGEAAGNDGLCPKAASNEFRLNQLSRAGKSLRNL